VHPALSHFTSPDFWSFYKRLTADAQRTADKYFALLKSESKHPSLHLNKIGDIWSVRAGLHYRAVGMDAPGEEALEHGRYPPFRFGPCAPAPFGNANNKAGRPGAATAVPRASANRASYTLTPALSQRARGMQETAFCDHGQYRGGSAH